MIQVERDRDFLLADLHAWLLSETGHLEDRGERCWKEVPTGFVSSLAGANFGEALPVEDRPGRRGSGDIPEGGEGRRSRDEPNREGGPRFPARSSPRRCSTTSGSSTAAAEARPLSSLSTRVLIDPASSRLEAWLAAIQTSPSQGAARQRDAVALAEALAALPDGRRQALELRYLKGQSLEEIALAMRTTSAAAAGLVHRGIKALRVRLDS